MLKIKNLLPALIGALCCFQACDNKEVMSGTLEGGMQYEFITNVEGQKTAEGDVVVMNVIYKDDKDSVIADTRKLNGPFAMKKDSTWKIAASFESCLDLMDKGDSAVFKVPAKTLFKSQMPPNIDPESIITIEASLKDIMSEPDYMAMVQELQSKARAEQMAQRRLSVLSQYAELIAEDGSKIDTYLQKNNIEAQTTESGIRYIISEQGSGEKPKTGQTVRVNYTGWILDGPVFDSSNEEVAKANDVFDASRLPYGPIEFPIGTGGVIMGWDEGIALLNEGGKGTLYIPSSLAYGDRQRSEVIKANSILVFDVELVEVVKN